MKSKTFQVDLSGVQTNILMMYLDKSIITAKEVQKRLASVFETDEVKVCVKTSSRDAGVIRFVTYWEISDQDVTAAVKKLQLDSCESHPYKHLLNFEPTVEQLSRVENIEAPKTLKETPLCDIDTKTSLEKLITDLKAWKELGVDVEYSDHGYKALTCLVQISTPDKDYIIDAIALKDELHALNEDYHVAKDKTMQRQDFRRRPLPPKFKDYARVDSHYLIGFYHKLKNELIEANLLRAVLDDCNNCCKILYPKVEDEAYLSVRRNVEEIHKRQLLVLEKLNSWRHQIAQYLDKNVGCVLSKSIKLKFCENERVLCYEPDPTKAKVLYDSKVLDVVVAKDQRGRKTVEYLIHFQVIVALFRPQLIKMFQGWNSSWDRYVSEEYVLKDTPENRQLQKDLAEKSQLQLGAYLYRRDRKKSRKTSTTAPSSDDCSSGSPTRMDTDDGQGVTSSSEDDSSIEEETVPIELTPELRACLEQDYCLINTKNKLVKLPAEPNVVTILENYWRHYANGQISDLNEKTSQRHRYPFNNTQRRRPEDVQRNLNICSEVLDGIRLYFDYTVNDLLLYKCEQGQIETKQAVYTSIHLDKEVSSSKNEVSYMDYITYPNNHDDYQNGNRQAMQRKRSLRSNKSTDAVSNGNSQDSAKAKASSSVDNNDSCGSRPLSLRLLPEHVYNQQPPPPCLVYGAIHLTRLFVKLPELLNAATIDEKKWTTLLNHTDTFIDYLNEHREWFGEKFYIDRQ
ncbi:Uncharacterized protein R102.4-like Protein [Tribolium castaneum]|nr:Uncharacterized protein R102.4-like Protein [Tribolium castaneum]